MQVNVTGHHVDVTSSLKGFVEKKLDRIVRHSDKVLDVHCILTVEKLRHKAEATVFLNGTSVYADAVDDQAVANLIERMKSGAIDAIAFTSTPQVERLFAAAPVEEIKSALGRTLVAAIGPVVEETLHRHGVQSLVMPEAAFFLKPLTTALEDALRAERR